MKVKLLLPFLLTCGIAQAQTMKAKIVDSSIVRTHSGNKIEKRYVTVYTDESGKLLDTVLVTRKP